jgi:hypothetical protein
MLSFALAFHRLYRVARFGAEDPEFRTLLTAALGQLVAGTVFYMFEEDWSFVDALYFCVTTLTTIGFGDPSPTSDFSKLFTIVYVFVGVGLIGSMIAALAERSRQIARNDQDRRNDH